MTLRVMAHMPGTSGGTRAVDDEVATVDIAAANVDGFDGPETVGEGLVACRDGVGVRIGFVLAAYIVADAIDNRALEEYDPIGICSDECCGLTHRIRSRG